MEDIFVFEARFGDFFVNRLAVINRLYCLFTRMPIAFASYRTCRWFDVEMHHDYQWLRLNTARQPWMAPSYGVSECYLQKLLQFGQ